MLRTFTLRTWLVEVSRAFARDAVREGMLAGISDAVHELGVAAGDSHADPARAAEELGQLVAQAAAEGSPQTSGRPGLLGAGPPATPPATPAEPLPEVSPREQVAALKAALEAGGQLTPPAPAAQQLQRRPGRPRKDGPA